MRWVLNEDERRLMPCTMYPFLRRNSARYAPSCPVIPVIRAVLVMIIIPCCRFSYYNCVNVIVSLNIFRGYYFKSLDFN